MAAVGTWRVVDFRRRFEADRLPAQGAPPWRAFGGSRCGFHRSEPSFGSRRQRLGARRLPSLNGARTGRRLARCSSGSGLTRQRSSPQLRR
jgi:hypothetical protein